ncbi:hypothetical protein D3C75_1015530 [compost metagenome]
MDAQGQLPAGGRHPLAFRRHVLLPISEKADFCQPSLGDSVVKSNTIKWSTPMRFRPLRILADNPNGAEPVRLVLLLFATTVLNFSMFCVTVGPPTSESVPPALVSTATGLVVGIGGGLRWRRCAPGIEWRSAGLARCIVPARNGSSPRPFEN